MNFDDNNWTSFKFALVSVGALAGVLLATSFFSAPMWVRGTVAVAGLIYLAVVLITTDGVWLFRKPLWRNGRVWMKVHAVPGTAAPKLLWQRD